MKYVTATGTQRGVAPHLPVCPVRRGCAHDRGDCGIYDGAAVLGSTVHECEPRSWGDGCELLEKRHPTSKVRQIGKSRVGPLKRGVVRFQLIACDRVLGGVVAHAVDEVNANGVDIQTQRGCMVYIGWAVF